MAEKTFWNAFVKAQSEFEHIRKDKSADAGKFKYEYASLPTVLEAVLPALNSNGISLWQCFRDGSLVTNLTHTSGEGVESLIACSDSGMTPQDFGKKISYYRRYSILALLGLAPDDDDDAQGVPAAPKASPAAPEAKPAPTTKGNTSKTVQGVLEGITTSENIDHQAAFEDAIHNLFDVGVGSLTGHADNPRKDMGERMARLLENVHRDRVSSITNRDEQTAFYHAMKDMVDALGRTTAP